jgi:hypothetical protein
MGPLIIRVLISVLIDIIMTANGQGEREKMTNDRKA